MDINKEVDFGLMCCLSVDIRFRKCLKIEFSLNQIGMPQYFFNFVNK